MTPCRRPCWTAGRWLRSRTSGAASTRLRNGCSVSRQRPRNDPLCSVSYPIAVNGRIASGQRSPELGSTTDFPRAPWLLTFNSESFPKHYAGKSRNESIHQEFLEGYARTGPCRVRAGRWNGSSGGRGRDAPAQHGCQQCVFEDRLDHYVGRELTRTHSAVIGLRTLRRCTFSERTVGRRSRALRPNGAGPVAWRQRGVTFK